MFKEGGTLSDLACCFTGHRVISNDEVPTVYSLLLEEIDALIKAGYTKFYAGGALGFDTLAEQAVLQKRIEHPQITLNLILPCKNQASRWSEYQQEVYLHLLSKADSIIYSSDKYSYQAMQKRNEMLVHHSNFCLCYLKNKKGGTAYTVRYAKKHGLPVKNLYEQSQYSFTLFDNNNLV